MNKVEIFIINTKLLQKKIKFTKLIKKLKTLMTKLKILMTKSMIIMKKEKIFMIDILPKKTKVTHNKPKNKEEENQKDKNKQKKTMPTLNIVKLKTIEASLQPKNKLN